MLDSLDFLWHSSLVNCQKNFHPAYFFSRSTCLCRVGSQHKGFFEEWMSWSPPFDAHLSTVTISKIQVRSC